MKNNETLLKCATYFSTITSFIILVIKLYAWWMTNSISILASLLDSFLDISASIINLLAIRYSLIPPDDDHRFGHDKIQDLSVFLQAIFFIISGCSVIGLSINRIINPIIIEHSSLGIWIMILSIFLTSFLILFQSFVIKRTNSKIIVADKLHYTIDMVTNLSVVLSLWISKQYNFIYLDVIFAILISFYVIHEGVDLIKQTFKNLMDEELSDDEKQKILNILSSEKKIIGVHEFKTRYAGNKAFIQFHIELDPEMKLRDAHTISDNIENQIKKLFEECEVIIHQDPAGFEEKVNYKENI